MTETPEKAPARSRWRQFGPPLGSVAVLLAFAHVKGGFHGRGLWLATIVAVGVSVASGRAETERTRRVFWTLATAVAVAAARGISPWFGLVGGAVGFLFASDARTSIRHAEANASTSPPPRAGTAARVVLAAVWATAVATYLAEIWRPGSPLAAYSQTAIVSASLLSLAVLALQTLSLWRAKQLSLDVPPRALVTLAACAGAALTTMLSLAERQTAASDVGTFGLGGVAFLANWAWGTSDGSIVARRGRRAAALGFVGGAVVMVGALAASGNTSYRWILVVATGGIALAIGAAIDVIEEPFLPVNGLWLRALQKAYENICERDPEEAIFATLQTLRTAFGPNAPSPQIWTISPPRVITIDMAGYIHEEEAELPDVIAVASGEVAATIRHEVLLANEVRRPELRPLSLWMARTSAKTATVITRNGQPEGLLVLPETGRADRLTLEEVLWTKRLADALAAACHERQREMETTARIVETERRAELAEAELGAMGMRHHLASLRNSHVTGLLARGMDVGTYSAAAQFAMDTLRAAAVNDTPAFIISVPGGNATAWAAYAHLEGMRRDAPFIIVQCTRSSEHADLRWDTPESSPLALANGGTLCLEDVGALPQSVQEKIASSLLTRLSPYSPEVAIDVQLVVTSAQSPDYLTARGQLHPRLARVLGAPHIRPAVMPALRERPEDMRALVTERLARAGLRWKGTPAGIDPAAFALLVERKFEGGEDELTLIVERAVQISDGEVVSVDVLNAVLGKRQEK